jgi:hypothetical protein
MIAGRAAAKYQNIEVDPDTYVMTFDFVVGEDFVDPVRLRLRDLPGVAAFLSDDYWIEAGEKMVRIWDGPVREAGSPVRRLRALETWIAECARGRRRHHRPLA